jgi:glucokinase
VTDFSRQAIVGDIGHTNIRFALADVDELTITNFAYLSTAMFSGPGEALRAYLRSIPERPSMVSIAVAGPVEGEAAKLGQLDWSFTADDIRSVIDARVHLVNDFEALAMLLPHLTEHDIHRIGGRPADDAGPRVVLGPGTMMQTAALIPVAAGRLALLGHGEAISFACSDQADLDLVKRMRPDQSFVAVGDILSSRGLVDLARALGKQSTGSISAADIVKAAWGGRDPAVREALQQFLAWLGSFAGDMALVYGARGGVYLAGGMAPALLGMLSAGGFRNAFEAKGKASSFLRDVPIHVITAPDACLRGAALAAASASSGEAPKLSSVA